MAFLLVAVKLAEQSPKMYGTDAMTPRAWLAVQTSTIRLGNAIAQVAA